MYKIWLFLISDLKQEVVILKSLRRKEYLKEEICFKWHHAIYAVLLLQKRMGDLLQHHQ